MDFAMRCCRNVFDPAQDTRYMMPVENSPNSLRWPI